MDGHQRRHQIAIGLFAGVVAVAGAVVVVVRSPGRTPGSQLVVSQDVGAVPSAVAPHRNFYRQLTPASQRGIRHHHTAARARVFIVAITDDYAGVSRPDRPPWSVS